MDSSVLSTSKPLLSENSIDLFYLCQVYSWADKTVAQDKEFFSNNDFLSSQGIGRLLEAFGQGMTETLSRLAEKLDLYNHHHCLFLSANIGASLLVMKGMIESLLDNSPAQGVTQTFMDTFEPICPEFIEEVSFTVHSNTSLLSERTHLAKSTFVKLYKGLPLNNSRNSLTLNDGLVYALELNKDTFPRILSDITSNLILNYSVDKSPSILLKQVAKIIELLAWGRMLASDKLSQHVH